ncbi:MAG: YneF family protein [Bacillales bacterium]
MIELNVGLFIFYLILAIIIGGVIGFFAARFFLKKELEKNPPINEKMIRAMFMQMGRKPSEAQIRAVMNSVKSKK